MARKKRVITKAEEVWLNGSILPPKTRWARMLDECTEHLEIMESSLNTMSTRMEWQFDENLDHNRPTHYPEEGTISVSSEDSHFTYKITAPLIHKRVKVNIPKEDFEKLEQIVSIYYRHLSNCSVLAALLGYRFERKQIVDMVAKRR